MSEHRFQDWIIIPHMMQAIRDYIDKGYPPGSFLTAVICGDLFGAVCHADYVNLANIPAFCDYFYNHAPRNCYGSKEKMAVWLKSFEGIL